jgi:S-DNA-T family DNA segregation ATPase FtsK/SpoIIIE
MPAEINAAEITAALADLGTPCVVLIDDLDLLAQNLAVDPPMREILRTGRDRGIGLACAGSAEAMNQPGSWIAEARRARQGVLLQPQSMNEGDIAGGRLPLEIVRRPLRLGRGYITHPTTGAVISVALPLTELRGVGAS